MPLITERFCSGRWLRPRLSASIGSKPLKTCHPPRSDRLGSTRPPIGGLETTPPRCVNDFVYAALGGRGRTLAQQASGKTSNDPNEGFLA
jgi:hypothetical protein